jgi:hypothetical protein
MNRRDHYGKALCRVQDKRLRASAMGFWLEDLPPITEVQ